MSKKQATCFRWFWVWQEEKETLWLKNMSLRGWHLQKVTIMIYTFQKGESKDLRYYLDFSILRQKDVPDYVNIFQDLGWNLVCRQGSWFYFTSPTENRIQEVYSDNQSKLKKYSSILMLHIVLIPIVVIMMNIASKRLVENNSILNNIEVLIIFLLLITTIYSTIKFIILVSKLRKDPKE